MSVTIVVNAKQNKFKCCSQPAGFISCGYALDGRGKSLNIRGKTCPSTQKKKGNKSQKDN